MASLALGWVGEPALAHLIEPPLEAIVGQFAPAAAHGVAIGASFAVITALHIVIGELAPKGLALQRPEATALWVARPMQVFEFVFRWPIALLNGVGQRRPAPGRPAPRQRARDGAHRVRAAPAGDREPAGRGGGGVRGAHRQPRLHPGRPHRRGPDDAAHGGGRRPGGGQPAGADRAGHRQPAQPPAGLRGLARHAWSACCTSTICSRPWPSPRPDLQRAPARAAGALRPREQARGRPAGRDARLAPAVRRGARGVRRAPPASSPWRTCSRRSSGPIEDEPAVDGDAGARPTAGPGAGRLGALRRPDPAGRVGGGDGAAPGRGRPRDGRDAGGAGDGPPGAHARPSARRSRSAGRTLRVEELDGRRVAAVRLLPPPDTAEHARPPAIRTARRPARQMGRRPAAPAGPA